MNPRRQTLNYMTGVWEIIGTGKHKGQRREDVDDASWTMGYRLPRVFTQKGQALTVLTARCISRHRIIIEKLPKSLKVLVNQIHNDYGVGRIINNKYFSTNCHYHPEGRIEYCRQCIMREDTMKLHSQMANGKHLEWGLLVRDRWISEEREPAGMMGAGNSENALMIGENVGNNCAQRTIEQEKERRNNPASVLEYTTPYCVRKIIEEVMNEKSPINEPVLRYARLTGKATTPTKGSIRAAGYDLYSAYDYTVEAKGKGMVMTDLQIAVPEGSYGRIAPRSGLAQKHFIDVGAGVVDEDYRGNVGVVLFNFGPRDFKIKTGDRVAQLIIERIYLPELVEMNTLGNTKRGAKGFGASGK